MKDIQAAAKRHRVTISDDQAARIMGLAQWFDTTHNQCALAALDLGLAKLEKRDFPPPTDFSTNGWVL